MFGVGAGGSYSIGELPSATRCQVSAPSTIISSQWSKRCTNFRAASESLA